MNSWLTSLMSTIAVPTKPDNFSGTSTPESLGMKVTLPHDYIEFMTSYGPGGFRKGTAEIEVWDISSPDASESIEVLTILAQNELHRRTYDVNAPHTPLFPEANGLLPWGCDNEMHNYFWETSSKAADTWPIVVFDRHNLHKFECTFVEFIARSAISDSEWCKYLPALEPSSRVKYVPRSVFR